MLIPKIVRTWLKEYIKFKQFADSLLSRATKLTELVGELEGTLEEINKGPETLEAQRVSRPYTQKFQDFKITE